MQQGEQLELPSVAKRVGKFQLGPVDLGSISPGSVLLLGGNGAGKSLFLGELANTLRKEGCRVSLLKQEETLPRFSRLRDVAAFVGWQRGMKGEKLELAVRNVFEVADLTERIDERCGALSGGMKRRLSVALTTLGQPEVILLDEPAAGLDVDQRENLRATITEVGKRIPVLFSSHELTDLNEDICRVVVLAAGKMTFDGSPPGFLSRAHLEVETGDSRKLAAYRYWTRRNA
ncbi:ATP-binding cassette domain-containing protein [Corynebacterium sp. TAE3-ERU12]|uniref:ATP-binding cassette domain-containing protein n=1 Tax=Corynebacterium sp. TAE3-ERU12 TaxID=2849491 RepID=UPI001C470A1F|nr:ATP-binding cassette domain-containing protein [Corynebacterium sp. TAE3-ERU12]MBV7294450.1 ATP-binding cassette domain-containing protein [Corynebacterium sp. TAE3-ERU12]